MNQRDSEARSEAGGDSFKSKRAGFVGKVAIYLAFAMFFLSGKGVAQVRGDGSEAPGHYFLVVDHSGSMLQPIRSGTEQGRSRWDLMRDRAASFIERLPEGSSVWVGVFSALQQSEYQKLGGKEPLPLDGWLTPLSADLAKPGQREELIAEMRNVAVPSLSNGTWLYQATATALDRVELVGARDPDAYMTVLVYTDGVDQGHGRTQSEMMKNPSSLITRETLNGRIRQLQGRHRNLNIIHVYSPGDESILDAHVVRLLTNRFQLPSPLVAPEQTLEIGLRFRDDAKIRLAGRPISFAWDVDPGSPPPPLRIEGEPFRMADGTTKVKLVTTADWPAARDISARLKLVYPKIENTFLVEEGGSTVEIFFQGAEAPSIRDLIPADGSAFPVGREIGFSLTTLPGCEVDWTFDDGTTVRGNPVTRNFDAPGTRAVNVKVTDPRTGLSGTATTSITLTELEVSIDPLPGEVVPGVDIELTASALGEFRSFDWLVGGRSFVGAPRPDGRPGSILRVSFDRPGDVPIRVVGRGSAGGIAEAEPAVLTVKTVPALRVPSPSAGESLYFGTRRELQAELEGVDANQIRFQLTVGDDEVFSRDVDVRMEGELRLAVILIDVPTLPLKSEGRLVVSTLGVEPVLMREIDVVLESEPASITILLPEGREPFINRETPVQLESNAAIENIRWNFGDGWVDGNTVTRHIWKTYGVFRVEAQATGPDGSQLVATPVEISVPIRNVEAAGKLLYQDRQVGTEVAKVPRRATLQLVDESRGDAMERRWRVNGKDLPAGQTTLVVEDRGAYEVELIVTGTPEAGEDRLVIAFQTSDRLVFWLYTMALALTTALIARFLLGNRWRHAEFGIQRSARTQGEPGVPDQRRFARLIGRDRVGRWSFWKKNARISLKKLDGAVCPSWQTADHLVFKPRGRDFSLLFAKGSPNHRLRVDPTDERGLRDPWVRRWTIMRPLNREHEALRGAIFLRLARNINPLRRWWPEITFVIFLGAALYVLRILAESYY